MAKIREEEEGMYRRTILSLYQKADIFMTSAKQLQKTREGGQKKTKTSLTSDNFFDPLAGTAQFQNISLRKAALILLRGDCSLNHFTNTRKDWRRRPKNAAHYPVMKKELIGYVIDELIEADQIIRDVLYSLI
jgi:hypothetical protein